MRSAKQRREVAQVKVPSYPTLAIGEFGAMNAKEVLDGGFVISEIAERCGVFQRELQRRERVVETDDAKRASRGTRGAEDGQDIGSSAETDVPDDKFAGVGGQSFGEAELFDVKRFGFGDGADDWMKRLAFSERMDAMDAAGEFDDFISGR